MTTISLDNGVVIHLGRPVIVPIENLKSHEDSLSSMDAAMLDKLTDVEQEEELEYQRKFEELHPEESGSTIARPTKKLQSELLLSWEHGCGNGSG
jgi:hypothetical protein